LGRSSAQQSGGHLFNTEATIWEHRIKLLDNNAKLRLTWGTPF
jgi:hypothetical protein